MERGRTPFGQRMLEARKEAKLTQMQVCKALDISQGTLSEAEHVANTSGHTPRFAELYRVSATWLATGEGDRRSGAQAARPPEPWPFERMTAKEWSQLTDREKGAGEEAFIRAVQAIRDARQRAATHAKSAAAQKFIEKVSSGPPPRASLVAAEPPVPWPSPPPVTAQRGGTPRKRAKKEPRSQ